MIIDGGIPFKFLFFCKKLFFEAKIFKIYLQNEL